MSENGGADGVNPILRARDVIMSCSSSSGKSKKKD